MEATTKDLRLHAHELLAATDRGEEVVITWRGKRRAKLVRWSADEAPAQRPARNPAFGLRTDDVEPVETELRRLRQRSELP